MNISCFLQQITQKKYPSSVKFTAGHFIPNTSVAGPDPYVFWASRGTDPVPDPDPSVPQAKIVRKTLIPSVL
jgi:hypothetical protein